MPIKRRADKAYKQLDGEMIEDHFYGPGTCLLNGCGYCGVYADRDRWEELTERGQATVLAAMEADWQRQSRTILDAWHARTDHDLYIARTYHGGSDVPWSQTRFGGGN